MKAHQDKTVRLTQTPTMQNGGGQPVRFLMTCAAGTEVYLHLRRADGSILLCTEMEPQGGSRWGLTLPLPAGTYRYRYYVESGRVMNYLSPADVDVCPVQMDGLDAVIAVTPERNPTRCSGAAVCGAAHRCHRRSAGNAK